VHRIFVLKILMLLMETGVWECYCIFSIFIVLFLFFKVLCMDMQISKYSSSVFVYIWFQIIRLILQYIDVNQHM